MHPDLAFEVWVEERQRRVEDVLDRVLPPADNGSSLVGAMRYAVLDGGKRVRPLLAYATAEAVNADPSVVDACAAAVELIHAYSLVHDDLPCMDDDVLRRGKPTCHVAFGEAMALLAGDALQAHAFSVLATNLMRDVGHACVLLADAAGDRGMAGGQAIDLAHVGRSMSLGQLESMHRKKTGALIRASVKLGAQCGRPSTAAEDSALEVYAHGVGLAFQIVDDILDVEGSATTLGKTAGKDAVQNKPTYVTLLGLTEAKRRAVALRDEVQACLQPFGRTARRLHEMAGWITQRSH